MWSVWISWGPMRGGAVYYPKHNLSKGFALCCRKYDTAFYLVWEVVIMMFDGNGVRRAGVYIYLTEFGF